MSTDKLRNKRLSLIRAIEKKRNSKVITYVTNDRLNLQTMIAEDVVPIINDHLRATKVGKDTKIDLFIYSRGGDSDVPWSLVSLFREYVPNGSFNVLIPYKAHSAATLISLGADEIVMSRKAEMGPIDATITQIDPQTQRPNSISVEDVNGYMNLLNKFDCSRSEEKMIAFQQLSTKVGPLELGKVNRILEQTKLVATRLLETRQKGNGNNYTTEEIKEIVRKISSEIYSHRHAISRTEGKNYLKLKSIKFAEDANIDKEMWDLYIEYNKIFQFTSPFNPESYLMENNLEEYTWKNLYIACIESNVKFDACVKSLKVKQIKNAPPQVTLNLNNVQLPPINIPSNLPGVDQSALTLLMQQYFQNVVPNLLQQVSINVAKEFMKSLPSQGFQRMDLSAGWIQS